MATGMSVPRPSNRKSSAGLSRWPRSFPKAVPQPAWAHAAMIAGVMALVSLFLSLGGCQRSARQQVTITILDPEWSQPDELPGAKRESQQFTLETGIQLKHLPVPETSLSQLDLWRKLLRGSDPTPDVLGVDVIWPGILGDYLIDLRPYFAAELSSVDPQLVASYTVNGKVVAIPYHAHIAVLGYRTDLLQKYGYRRPPRTWDELEEMAARIQTGERARGKKDFWGYVWQGAPGEGLTCNALEWQVSEGGGQIIENDRTISVNNPDTIHAWQRARRWVGWISPPSVVTYRELDSLNLWDTGGAAFRRTWQWDDRLTHWQQSVLGEKTGFTGMPGGRGGRAGTLGGIGLAVSRSSAHPQEAIALIRFLIHRELQSRKDSADTSPLQQPEVYDLPNALGPYGQSATSNQKGGDVIARPSIIAGDAYESVTKAYFQAVHSVLVGEKGAPEAAAALEKQLVETTGFKTGPPLPRGLLGR
jgi:trehalose/maltose transport system substrate-binding protein